MKLIAQVGTIQPPPEVAVVNPGQASEFVAGLVRAAISLLLIVGFVLAFIWIMFAGFRFFTSGGDEKAVAGAWSQIYWGLIGMAVVVGAYAIIRLVETFFGLNIITGGFQIPHR